MLYNLLLLGDNVLSEKNQAKNLSAEILNSLSEEERRVALTILKEYSESGMSTLFDDLLLEDYKEAPVDIITFLLNDNYLGKAWHDADGKVKLFDFWKNKLGEIFPSKYDTSVNNLIISGARGLGKSEVATACIMYLMYRIMCMKNPLQYFGLKPTEKICFAFMNITKKLAEEIGNSKFQKTIQLSPWFMSKGTMLQRNNEPYWEPPAPIEVIIGSQSSHVIGKPIFAAFFDEISFIRNQDIDKQKRIAIDMIDTAIGGMKTRFIKQGGKNPTLLILASSKRSEKSFLEEHMKKKLKSEGDNVIIIDEPVWKVQPKENFSQKTFRVALGNKFLSSQVIPETDSDLVWKEKGYKILHVPMNFKPDFLDDIDRALCDFAGISSSEISKYINGTAVRDIVSPKISNPFSRDIIEVGNAPDDTAQYKDFFDITKIDPSLKYKPLFIHLDMSISGDMTGIAGVFIKGKKISTDSSTQNKDLFFSLGFSVSIKAPKGRQISFEKNRNFIYWLKEQGFNIKGITSDTFQSYDTGQTLKSKGYPYEILSVDRVDSNRVCIPYQYFKSTIYEKRLEIYDSTKLIDEIIDLERNINTGKVDHPEGGSKDVCDAVCGAIFNASKHAEEFAFEWGESIESILENSSENIFNLNKQITVDFEEELKHAFAPQPSSINKTNNQNTTDKSKSSDVPFIADGMIIW